MKTCSNNKNDMAEKLNEAEKASLKKAIATATYYKAEKTGFEPGCEQQDWMEAEMEFLCIKGYD